jgi:hypothetical protein
VAVTKLLIAGLFLAVMACGGDSEDEEEPMQETEMLAPDGCYIIMRMMCDCALTAEQCTGEGMVWAEDCRSCEM